LEAMMIRLARCCCIPEVRDPARRLRMETIMTAHRTRTRMALAMLRRVPAVLALAAAPAWAQGQAAVRGEVVAAADGSPLPGVTVTLRPQPVGQAIEATTDADGAFALEDLRPGEYVLLSSPQGFAPRAVRFVLKPRELRAARLSLELQPIEVRVDVEDKAPLSAGTHSPSSTVLTAQRIETLPLGQRASLPEAIVTAAPGMVRAHDDFVHVRGHEVALNPVINGVSFWENPHAVLSPGLSPEVIEVANVMTGGFSAEYGNRFGGVVDIVTKSGAGMANVGAAGLSLGEVGRRRASAEYRGHHGRLGYFLSGTLFESDRFLSPPDPRAIHDQGRGAHVFAQLEWDLAGAGSLRTVLMGDGANFEIPRSPLDVELRPLARATQRTRQQTAILGWARSSASGQVSASLYQRWSRARLLPAEGPLTARAAFERELLTAGGKADLTRLYGRHTVKAGFDAVWLRPQEDLSYDYSGYRDLTHELDLPHIHVTGGPIVFAGRETGGQLSGYVQDSIRLGRLTADLGVRVDRYDLAVAATHASPRANLALRVGRGAVLHASYNRFFVPPPIEGILSSSGGLTGRIREIGAALPALEPTVEDQFELGAAVPLGPSLLTVTGYYRTADNPVHTTVWPDSRVYSYASFDRERAYGLEVKAELPRLARYGLAGYLNYALGRVHFYNPVTGGFVTEAAHLTETSRFLAPMDQTHTLTSGLGYRHARSGLWLATTVEYGSGTPMAHGDSHHEHGGDSGHGESGHDADEHGDSEAGDAAVSRVPGHFTASVSLGLDLLRRAGQPRLSFQVDLENVTDNVYLVASEGEFTAVQYAFPRALSASVRVRF
jgi:hypothetical protein